MSVNAGPVLLCDLPEPDHERLVAGNGEPRHHRRLHQPQLLRGHSAEVEPRLDEAVPGRTLDVAPEPVAVHADLADQRPLAPLLRNVAERLRRLSVDGGHVVGGGCTASQRHVHAGLVHAARVCRVREPRLCRERVILQPLEKR